MEATGVYWIPLYQNLPEANVAVYRSMPGMSKVYLAQKRRPRLLNGFSICIALVCCRPLIGYLTRCL